MIHYCSAVVVYCTVSYLSPRSQPVGSDHCKLGKRGEEGGAILVLRSAPTLGLLILLKYRRNSAVLSLDYFTISLTFAKL